MCFSQCYLGILLYSHGILIKSRNSHTRYDHWRLRRTSNDLRLDV